MLGEMRIQKQFLEQVQAKIAAKNTSSNYINLCDQCCNDLLELPDHEQLSAIFCKVCNLNPMILDF